MRSKKEIGVLFSCCSWHVNDIARTLLDEQGNVQYRVYASNCYEEDLPTANFYDGVFVLPRIDSDGYIQKLTEVCKSNRIDVIVPMSTLELELMSKNKGYFHQHGISVLVNKLDVIRVLNDKIALYNKYHDFMPLQEIANISNVNDFLSPKLPMRNSYLCCKVNGKCGGKGFAVIDNEKCNDSNYFHAYGKKHYISTYQFNELVKKSDEGIILQKYIDGVDYTITMLCRDGEVISAVGYYGYELEFGAIMKGEIKKNDKACEIATLIAKELKIDGIVSFDFIVKNEDVYLLECNPRVNASLAFVKEAGVNMLHLECCNACGILFDKPVDTQVKYGLKMKKYFGSEYYV